MRRVTRKRFLQMTAASVAAASAPRAAYAQTSNFVTIAKDPAWVRRGPPRFVVEEGLAGMSRRLGDEGLEVLSVFADPRSGPYVRAWMFGGSFEQAVYRQASIELQIARMGSGYHAVELFLGDLYPHDFWDHSPVEINGSLMNGFPVRRFVPRMMTLGLPPATFRIFATLAGHTMGAFHLGLPEFHVIPTS